MPISKLQADWIKKATLVLEGMGCLYTIAAPDGSIWSNEAQREVTAKPKKTRDLSHPYGYITAYLRQKVGDLKIGEVIEVQVEGISGSRLQRALTSFLCRTYGKASCTTRLMEGGTSVEVLRVS